ncbi:hypothetical protein D8674_006214 [Pyrus ussuriensis x Pyrus communis]|uniref:Uncharacterized protein n=1 Tax=Pyrus ussuriensis x Pyrus communis TaxID=2448454 RepID=A0A5N5FUE3_9ROSA|nr:hypothetical protein D8674_006214 [Pyrus ussuriensis x Pyrus communis]
MNTSDDDVEELEDGLIICTVVRAVKTYYLKYVHKTPCSRKMNATKILGMFLHMLGHGVKNRLAQERFQHSGETVSRYFGAMLDIVCKMAIDIIKPMDLEFRGIPQEIRRDTRYMPYFKDCIGAIDGVHVKASIPPSDQVPYIGRKGIPTQNVMVACNFDMQFTFACAGWEGTAHDTRVFLSVLRNPNLNFSKPPNGIPNQPLPTSRITIQSSTIHVCCMPYEIFPLGLPHTPFVTGVWPSLLLFYLFN